MGMKDFCWFMETTPKGYFYMKNQIYFRVARSVTTTVTLNVRSIYLILLNNLDQIHSMS